jgi:hypothetical protein
MELLFKMDIKNYLESDIFARRPSARAIIWTADEKLAMVYSRKYKYYKFPGGGIHADEDKIKVLAREVQEETGLAIKKDTLRNMGVYCGCRKAAGRKIRSLNRRIFIMFARQRQRGNRNWMNIPKGHPVIRIHSRSAAFI